MSEPDLRGLNASLRRWVMKRAAQPDDHGRHFQELFDSLEEQYGESGAHFGALFASIVNERTQHVNINIANSQVGNFNLGEQIGTVNTAVHVLAANPDTQSQALATALKGLTESIHASAELAPEQKKESLELLAELANQAQAPPEQRSTGVLKSVVTGLAGVLSATGTLSALWAQWGPAVRAYFGF